jgi:large subunit ribosomal protein L10
MRPEKANIVSDLSEELKESSFVLVADYQHMKVDDFSELRKRLAGAGAEIHVVKNSFLKRALADSGLPAGDGELTGQTAVVTGKKDVAPVAKAFKTFVTEFKKAMLKVGFVNRAAVSTAELETLADLPPGDVLRAQLLGLLLSPATKLVRILNEPGSALARLLNAKAGKGEPAAKDTASTQTEPTAPVKETPSPPAPETSVAESKDVTAPAETKKEEPPATEVTG